MYLFRGGRGQLLLRTMIPPTKMTQANLSVRKDLNPWGGLGWIVNPQGMNLRTLPQTATRPAARRRTRWTAGLRRCGTQTVGIVEGPTKNVRSTFVTLWGGAGKRRSQSRGRGRVAGGGVVMGGTRTATGTGRLHPTHFASPPQPQRSRAGGLH